VVRRIVRLFAVATVIGAMMALSGPAFAEHAHYLDTQQGTCVEDIARGQTAISDEDHGGYHRFHENVHKGPSGDPATPGEFAFAKESNPVSVNRGTCPAG
jgi:hypothetical protein